MSITHSGAMCRGMAKLCKLDIQTYMQLEHSCRKDTAGNVGKRCEINSRGLSYLILIPLTLTLHLILIVVLPTPATSASTILIAIAVPCTETTHEREESMWRSKEEFGQNIIEADRASPTVHTVKSRAVPLCPCPCPCPLCCWKRGPP